MKCLPLLRVLHLLGRSCRRIKPRGLLRNGVGVLCFDLGVGFSVLGVEIGLFPLGELLQEQQRRLHARAGGKEGLLGQAHYGADEGAVLAELAHVSKRRIVEDAFGQDDAEPSTGLQQGKTAFDEENFSFDFAFLALGQFKEARYGLVHGGTNASQGVHVEVTVIVDVVVLSLATDRPIRFMDHVGRLEVSTEGRIGEDDVEAAFENAVDVQESVMVMDPAVAVAMHDHVHLAGARHAIVGVGAEDAAVGQLPKARDRFVRIEGFLDGVELLPEHRRLLVRRDILGGLHLGLELLVLAVGVGQNLLSHNLEEADQETAGTAGGVANHVPLLRIHYPNHELDNGSRGEELPNLAPEGATKESLESNPFDVLAGVGKIVAFQQLDDFTTSGEFEPDFLIALKNLVIRVGLLGLPKERVERVLPKLVVKILDGEEVLPRALGPQFSIDIDLHEENLGDFVKGSGGVELLAIADDVMAIVEQFREFVFLEDFQAGQ